MSTENIQRSSGRNRSYKLDRGGAPAESGPFIGEVRNNVDPTRSGRLQVYIEDFAGPDKNNPDLWRDVSYISPYYGYTQQSGTDQGAGSYVGNSQSYGFWGTPPDIGTKVICFFASGDPNQGYYIGCIVEPGINHMLPAIGATSRYQLESNSAQAGYFSNAPRLPVVEINDSNDAISANPRFFDEVKPVHSYVAGVMLQQGVINDIFRGPIGSNSQRESPSTVYGISTPGRPIYSGGLSETDIQQKLETGEVSPQEAIVIARRGGHSIVLDDGDLNGNDQLIRVRTAKGHQIILSDSGDALHIMHANGQSWVELGSEGTIDLYATNSVNIRSQGDVNIHADKNINLNSKSSVNINSDRSITAETSQLQLIGQNGLLAYSEKYVGIKSDGTLSLQSAKTGTWNGGSNMSLSAGCISLNGGTAPEVPKASNINKKKLPDVTFVEGQGWTVEPNILETIVSRAPTHEPYPLHGRGVNLTTNLSSSTEDAPFPAEVETRIESVQDVEFNAITAEQYEQQSPVDVGVGSILPEQVTGMLAQASADVPQAFNEISNDLGVGKFGLSADQLEKAGFLKPGTVDFYLKDATATLTDVLQSPSVWTGVESVNNIGSFLGDEQLQDIAQTNLYQTALTDLRNTGIATGQESPSKLAGLVQAGSKYGADGVKKWVADTDMDSVFKSDMDKLVRGGQYSVDLATEKLNENIKGYTTSSNQSSNTTIRSSVDVAVKQVINNEKVPAPSYTTRLQSTGNQAEIARLQSQVTAVTAEIKSAADAYIDANPGTQFRDFVKTQQYSSLVAKRNELQRQLEAARTYQVT